MRRPPTQAAARPWRRPDAQRSGYEICGAVASCRLTIPIDRKDVERGGRVGRLRTRGLVLAPAAVAGIALVAAVAQLPSLVRIGYGNSTQPLRLVRDADLDPFASFAPTAPLVAAQQLIPRDASYAIVVGNAPPVADPAIIPMIYRFWLLPRRYTRDRAAADWVIAYHRASESLGVPYTQELGAGPGVNILKVAR
jgi:hypothetical protein